MKMMKNWGWIVVAVLLISVLGWYQLGGAKPKLICHYNNEEIEQICTYRLQEDSLIKSPLKINGRARGNWFFEASFPIQILDQNDQVLAQALGIAQGDWMTEDLVPFTAEIKFEMPLGDTGKLVLKKDNPSGLPDNDDSFIIPVRFR
ncbi:MAG: Gmad2 immunoglobulin-like domain-containing protein [Patescibacteria group bacterium]